MSKRRLAPAVRQLRFVAHHRFITVPLRFGGIQRDYGALKSALQLMRRTEIVEDARFFRAQDEAARALVLRMLRDRRDDLLRSLITAYSSSDLMPAFFEDVLATDLRLLTPVERLSAWKRVVARQRDFTTLAGLVGAAIMTSDIEELAAVVDEVEGCAWDLPGENSPRAAFLAVLGESLHILRKRRRAHKHLTRAVRLDRLSARPHFALSAVLSDLGDAEESRLEFKRGLKCIPDPSAGLEVVLDFAQRRWSRSAPRPEPQKTEVFVFTNVTQKLKKNAHLAAPGVGLVETTLNSLHEAVQGAARLKTTVMFDKQPTRVDDAYEKALRALCDRIGATLVVSDQNRLRSQWKRAAGLVTADIAMFVEHDWAFRLNCPRMNDVLSLFQKNPDLNYLRLNKRINVPTGMVDIILLHGERDSLARVSRISSYTNMPHFIRADFLREVIVPLISDRGESDAANAGAGGVEGTVRQAYMDAMHRLGVTFSMRLFGTFVWGPPMATKRIVHLGI